MKTKRCSKCGDVKSHTFFHKSYDGAGGVKSYCMDCVKTIGREYREANIEKIAERKKAHYASNREKIAEKSAEYREANREKTSKRMKAYTFANKDRIKAYQKEHRKRNKAILAAVKRIYYASNRERCKTTTKQYRARNIDEIREKEKEYARKAIDKMSDVYVAKLIGLNRDDIPRCVLELKRAQLTLKREARRL